MSVLKQNKIEDDKCDLHDPEGNFLWTINSLLELNDVRIQIKEKSLEGYYLVFMDNSGDVQMVKINKDGRIINWPRGFYDTLEYQLDKLFTNEY